MIRITRDGRTTVLTLDSATAALAKNLLCVARPVGAAELGGLRVVVIDDLAPPPAVEPHVPVNAR